MFNYVYRVFVEDEDDLQPRSTVQDEPQGIESTASRCKKYLASPVVKAWRGFYCVPLCRSSIGDKSERKRLGIAPVSFHAFPDPKTQNGKECITKIRRDPGPNFRKTKYTKICSLHFTPQDFKYSELQLSKVAVSLHQQQYLRLADHDKPPEVSSCHDLKDTIDACTTSDEADMKVQKMMLQVEELKAKCQGLEEEVENLKAIRQELEV